MTTVTVENVTKHFYNVPTGGDENRVTALQNVSLKIESGSVLAILGPSGCGKSTLLRIIAGLMQPDEGQVYYDNVPVNDVDRRERNIGMVFQEGALIPHWEARKSVGFFLSLRKREEEIPEKVFKIASITGFGLDVLLERRPAHLSGGEKQRVSIARALTRDLDILLMDEPFANIDAKLRAQARVELKRLMQEFPVTSVYVTHDQIEAVSLSRKVAVMNEGGIEQVGTYQQLYENPINLFVATFVGTPPINLFNGFVISHTWRGDSFAGFDIRQDLNEGMPVVMGVRPEHITIAQDGDRFIAEGVIRDVTPYYAERFQLLTVQGNGEEWIMQVPPDFYVERKDRIRCAIKQEHVLYFDPETQLRIG